MNIARKSRLLALTGVVVFCSFAGDIVADSIADLRGDHCVCQTTESDSHHEKGPCSHCSCAVHNGSVLTSTVTVPLGETFQVSISFSTGDPSALAGLPAAIDHPPQLA
jgi:hypothetical protein